MNSGLFDSLRADRLQWLPELGLGWFPVTGQPYDRAYWDKYRALDATPCGDALTAMRVALVAKYWDGEVTDIGVGGGRFVTDRPQTWGFDVNPFAVQWLYGCNKFRDPYVESIDVATMWDALEHIHDPTLLLKNIRKWVFVSMPIFTGCDDVLRSKHFKTAEHVWYWTVVGIYTFMRRLGFEGVEWNRMEREAGREGIDTFVFKRT